MAESGAPIQFWRRTTSTRYASVALSVVAISYYVTFINMVMYAYDRFLLPILVIQALFAGLLFDGWLRAPRRQLAWRQLAAGAVFACSLLYAGMANALMVRGTR